MSAHDVLTARGFRMFDDFIVQDDGDGRGPRVIWRSDRPCPVEVVQHVPRVVLDVRPAFIIIPAPLA